MSKVKSKAKIGVTLLFISELFLIISIFSLLAEVTQIEYLWMLAILAIPGMILGIIGIVKIRNTCVPFNNAFWCFIIELILAVAAVTFNSISVETFSETKTVADVIDVVSSAVSVLSTYFIIKGCGYIVNGSVDGKFGRSTLFVYCFSIFLTIAFRILLWTPMVAENDAFMTTVSLAVIVFTLLAYIMYVFLLGRTARKAQ